MSAKLIINDPDPEFKKRMKEQVSPLHDESTRPYTVTDWVITLIVLSIPIVNIVMCVIWGFFSDGNQNRKTFCQASLIMAAIGIALMLLAELVL